MCFQRKKQKHLIGLTISISKSPALTPMHLLGTSVHLGPAVSDTSGFPARPHPTVGNQCTHVAKLGLFLLHHPVHQAFFTGLLKAGLGQPRGQEGVLSVWTQMEAEDLLLLGSPTFLPLEFIPEKMEAENQNFASALFLHFHFPFLPLEPEGGRCASTSSPASGSFLSQAHTRRAGAALSSAPLQPQG